MATTDSIEPESDGAAPTGRLADSFREARLQWPQTRAGWVERTRLLNQLERATELPVVLIAAPAGSGKTTLVAQWLAGDRHTRAAWVSLDSDDNDPVRLWTQVGAALERAGCAPVDDAATFAAAHSPEMMTAVLAEIVKVLAATSDDTILVLDDFHVVRERMRHDEIEFLVQNLPPQAHLVIVTRSDPGLRLGRLRASGRLAEIRAADLGFNDDEASALLAHQGVQLSSDAVTRLVERTEGWAAGLYLAALSLSGRPDPEEFVRQFSGGNRFVGDYLTEEVLSRQTDQVRDFITTVSVLDRFSASLCDFVVGATSSARILHDLERNNLFLVPLDDEGGWYRFHQMFAAVARSEFEAEHPDRIQSVHGRAAEWFRDHGHVDEAIRHGLAAGRTADASLLVQASATTYVDLGRPTTARDWVEFSGTPPVSSDPAASVTAAWIAALFGDEAALAEHLGALEEFRDYGPLPDGTRSVESAIALIQGLFGYGGPVEMMSSARRAVELETDGRSPYHAIANLTLGHSAYVAGDLDLAASRLAKSSHSEAAPAIIRVLSLSTESLVESERGQHGMSRELAEFAMEIVEAKGLRSMPQASTALTALGLAEAGAGDITDAMATLREGLALSLKNPVLGPWGTLHHLLVMARVAVDAGHLALARELLRDITRRMNRYGAGMGTMRARLAAVQDALRQQSATGARGESLTGRELDVLRLLQGALSLNEIADELYLSSNTVKTHTQAVYRKLGAHSRTEAVRIARQHLLI